MTALATPAIAHGRNSPLSDDLRRARIRGFFDSEAIEGDWWAVMRLENRDLLEASGVSYRPDRDIRDWARKVCHALNDEIHFNGVWTIVVFRGGGRWGMGWKDWDGDIQIVGDDEIPVTIVQKVKRQRFVEHGQEMVETWIESVWRSVELRPEQTVKLAAGEKPKVQVVPDEWARHGL